MKFRSDRQRKAVMAKLNSNRKRDSLHLSTVKPKSIPLKNNASNWVNDRIENREPLMLGKFEKFMVSQGYKKKDIKPLKKEMRDDYYVKKERLINIDKGYEDLPPF